MGAMSYTLAGTDVLKLISELNRVDRVSDDLLLQRLGPFLVAGLQAPLVDLVDLADLSENPTPAPTNSSRRGRN